MKLALLHSTIRADEKLLIQAAKQAGVKLQIIDVREQVFGPDYQAGFDIALERCLSSTLTMASISFFEDLNTPIINSAQVARRCENKFTTSMLLSQANIDTPAFTLAFNESQAKQAVAGLGDFPVVIKPMLGSWGRLIAKVNDSESLEAIIEHKHILGSPSHKPIYLQQYISKPQRDIRVTMINHQPICAIYRRSDHWITNTARGAVAKKANMDTQLEKICVQTSRALGGGILGIDVFEGDSGYLVNEVNHTIEFKNVQRVTGINVAAHIINYCQQVHHENS